MAVRYDRADVTKEQVRERRLGRVSAHRVFPSVGRVADGRVVRVSPS